MSFEAGELGSLRFRQFLLFPCHPLSEQVVMKVSGGSSCSSPTLDSTPPGSELGRYVSCPQLHNKLPQPSATQSNSKRGTTWLLLWGRDSEATQLVGLAQGLTLGRSQPASPGSCGHLKDWQELGVCFQEGALTWPQDCVPTTW